MNFAANFNETISAFAKFEVDFLIVGGYAVNFYGLDRNTSDLDIWINPVEENKKKIYDALVSIGYDPETANQIFTLDFSGPCAFKLGDEKYPVDIFTDMLGIKFQEAAAEKVLFQAEENVNIYFISLKHLVLNKMLVGRSKDKFDVDALQTIVRFTK